MAINLSEDDISVLRSITWCAHCCERPANGLYMGARQYDDGNLIPYRIFLCATCAASKAFKKATRLTNRRVLSAEQSDAVERWLKSLRG